MEVGFFLLVSVARNLWVVFITTAMEYLKVNIICMYVHVCVCEERVLQLNVASRCNSW